LDRAGRALDEAAAERVRLADRLERRQQALLDVFAAEQAELAGLVSARVDAERRVARIERRRAMRSATLPFGDWAERFLGQVGAPACLDNLVVVVAWQANEFTEARWNPLATTHRMPGSTDFNEVGVQNYRSLHQGLRASRDTLADGAPSFGYEAILDGLRRCDDAMVTAEAVRTSAWCRGCSGGGYVTDLVPIVQAYYERYADQRV
jgi:hypothetical protein